MLGEVWTNSALHETFNSNNGAYLCPKVPRNLDSQYSIAALEFVLSPWFSVSQVIDKGVYVFSAVRVVS